MKKEESKLQAQLFTVANNDPFFRYCIWSTPNGLFLNDNWGVINEMKATGSLKGVWDLTVQKNNKLFFIETKIGRNDLTKEQIHFRDVRISNGVPPEHFFVYKTIDEGLETLSTIKQLCNE